MSKKQLAAHLIDKYRELIIIRYSYEDMKKRLTLDPLLTREIIVKVRDYFLNSIYPEAPQREKLEKAFKTLGSFISKPSKIWRLLGNMALAIFKFGRLFPIALKAGLKSLQSYINAKEFEKNLLYVANRLNLSYPLSREDFKHCLYMIPRKDAESFMLEIFSLFNYIANEKLVKITIDIMNNVIKKMIKYPRVYEKDDIDGIVLGKTILENGYWVFHDMDQSTKKLVLEFIKINESWFLDEIYSRNYS